MSQKYAAYDKNGAIIGFYADDLHGVDQIPAQSIQITDAEWQACLAKPGYTVDVKNGVLMEPAAPALPDQLAAVKAAKSAELAGACQAEIYAGFDSAALGEVHHYPAGQTDQLNLNACVTQSYFPGNSADWTIGFWCADAAGVWEKRPHTAQQIQQAGNDGVNTIQAALNKNDSLQRQLAGIQATDTACLDSVASIKW